MTQLNWIYRWLDHGADSVNGGKNVKKSITGHTGWSQDLDFAFAHRDEVCNSLKRQKPHDPSAPYDGYDESDDTEEGARNNPLVSVNDVEKRKVLLFGAGVIGAYLAHVLIQAGNEVTILAREERAKSLSQNGLVIKHHLQRKTTKDPVEAVTDVSGRSFDAAFVVMPFHKIRQALPQIRQRRGHGLSSLRPSGRVTSSASLMEGRGVSGPA